MTTQTITRIANAFFATDAWWEDNKSSISIEIGDLMVEATATFATHYQYNEIDGTTESVDKIIDSCEDVTINAWLGEKEITINPDLIINALNN